MKSPSRVRLLATPWTAAYQAPPSMGFYRQEYWSGVPLPSPNFTFAFHFHALEEEMATHSSVLAWRIPWTEEPGGLLSIGSQSQTQLKRLSMHACIGEGNATHSNILAWRIPGTEEPGGLPSMGSYRVGHN